MDSTPAVKESNMFVLITVKSSINANIKKQIQMGKIAFVTNAEGRI